jgi:hypothetical protein
MVRSIVLALQSALIASALIVGPVGAQAAGWQPGPGAILDNTYDGFIDAPASGATVPASGLFTVSGWFVDSAAQGWAGADQIQVWLGTMGGGGKQIANAQIAMSRPDVAAVTGNPYAAASGFSALVDGAQVGGGPQTLYVYAHTGGKGWWFKQVNVNGGGTGGAAPAPAASAPAASAPAAAGSAPQLTIDKPAANENVSTKSTYSIEGTASDPGFGPAGIDVVDVFINGERGGAYSTELGTATPDSQGQWMLQFEPTKYPSMHSNLFVYAHSRNTGKETLATREFTITDH